MIDDPFSTKHFLCTESGSLCTFIYYLVLSPGKEPLVMKIQEFEDPYKTSERRQLSVGEIAQTEINGKRLAHLVSSRLGGLGLAK
jgi:hypothetical protein